MIRSNLLALGALAALVAPLSAAPPEPLSTRESFRIGSSGVSCTAQLRPMDARLKDMFDRGYAIVCRDAAAPVGSLYALKGDGSARLAAAGHQCGPDQAAEVPGLAGARVIDCESEDKLRYRTYTFARRGTLFAAEGLAGYDSALKLGLASIVSDRPVTGEVQVAVTAAGDPAAFARVQAGALDADGALQQGYARSNEGSYAEAAEFFQTLSERTAGMADAPRLTEYLVNQGLQQSNLGQFPAATAAFEQAEARGAAADPIAGRLLRNYRALHQINQKRPAKALEELQRPVAEVDRYATDALSAAEITPRLAQEINRANAALNRTGGLDSRLQPYERAQILDAQKQQIQGIALRLQGRYAEALRAFDQAERALAGVRQGRVASTAFMRSEILGETGIAREMSGDTAAAGAALTRAVALLEASYPQSAALLQAKSRLASFYARTGRADEAVTLYAAIVADSEHVPGASAAMRDTLAPYFRLLAARSASDPNAAAAMFSANQIFVRPGVAQTQAVLARELSEGDDEAAMLFREAVNQSREVVRQTAEVANLAAANPPEGGEAAAALAAARDRLKTLEGEQTALQSRLSKYPRYRVLSPQTLTLADLQKTLRPGEAYYQLRLVGQDAYAVFATPERSRAVRIAANATTLGDSVARLRDSIVKLDSGQLVTTPFDLVRARQLYATLFDPIGGDALAGVKHLIFEPDGPLLQLPVSLLVADQASVDTYQKRIAGPAADKFDMRGVAWLGKDREVTTAVSARSFADVRQVAPSAGKRAYLGLGENAPPFSAASFLSTSAPANVDPCDWPLETWNRPISAAELQFARSALGAQQAAVLTGAEFADTNIVNRSDLRDYRVLHFATHGLVTAPRPQCPARPALLTSFGGAGSDGLLSFKEVYDLKIDADWVILSACDTAGMATVSATREAGIATGGNYALDGLVRAFVGAGARAVIASHWPVPDDYDATKRLITGLFSAPAGTPAGQALRAAQVQLMDDANTSHPYYWAAFAIVGDAERPLLQR
ncbi:CHAT domain-containing protein [Sphingomonas sp. ID1715]|uniref:CHAT domain-containing protein n=1 Tax=Sphingomonas sp. ID1715 TaxID=1656898 RepID=UPI0014885D28|nr:CHAT domain-containing tetratricopeptide repeat protein [Sphingomonas sp. ID1715]NNM76168.1 CHAT domain-containing protein [Sphingomonas sp. ID1715]